MGTNLTPNTCEDKLLQAAIKNNNKEDFSRHCSHRNERSNVWAFKVPAFRSKLVEYSAYLRNLRVTIVYRNPLTVALSNMNYLGIPDKELIDTLGTVTSGMNKLSREIEKYDQPIMLIPVAVRKDDVFATD